MSADVNRRNLTGIVGIGLLGSALVERLVLAGFEVCGYDRSEQALGRLTDLGGHAASGLEELVLACRRILLCLPDSTVVEEILTEIQAYLSPQTVIIDTTTGDPRQTKGLAGSLSDIDVELVDATVLGSGDVTRRGQAVLMVGANPVAFERCQPVLKAISSHIHYLGPAGSGQEMKLVANLVLGLNRAALAEGLYFAKNLGLNPRTVLAVLKSGAAWSRVMDDKGEKMIHEDFAPQARLSQHLKDVRLILSQAEDHCIKLPLSKVHRNLLQGVEDAGGGDLDNSAVIRAW